MEMPQSADNLPSYPIRGRDVKNTPFDITLFPSEEIMRQ